jgi:hypothetical protein
MFTLPAVKHSFSLALLPCWRDGSCKYRKCQLQYIAEQSFDVMGANIRWHWV